MAIGNDPALLFDLDGTLVDSVYQHVLAWREALEDTGIELAVWRIHRRIGMSGGLFANALLRETGHRVTADEAARLQRRHAEAHARRARQVRPLPGALELLQHLTAIHVPWAIATSGRAETARSALALLDLPPEAPVVTRDVVQHAKPDPGPVHRGGAAGRGADHSVGGRGRQRLGSARGPSRGGARGGFAIGRLRAGRAGARRRLSRLSGPCRPAATPR
jgi:phosphoglycolate phosphatase-like HAD superfamily hydrolase